MDPLCDKEPTATETAAAALRRRAAALALAEVPDSSAHSPAEMRSLIHELQVHQIELELQNEELRRAQQELEAAHARYFDLYDLAPVGYVTLSALGLIQEANLTAATMLALPRGALLRQPLSRFIVADDQAIYYRYHRALQHAGGPQVCELRMLRPELAPLWVRLEAVVAPGAPEQAIYRVVLIDITARVAAELAVRELNASLERRIDERTAALQLSEASLRHANADLARALRLKDEFLAMMSHELRTPLSVILSIADALMEEIYGPLVAPQRRALETVTQSGQHLLALLSDILDLSRTAVEEGSLELQPVDIDIVCQLALQMVTPDSEAKGIQLRHTVAPQLTGFQADERRLTQILVNLLSNAVKFTPAGGTVGLEVAPDATRQHLLLSVWDNGVGIAPADQERIFEPFVQVDARLARQYGGSGLGLALVRHLVALHGGSVSLVSAIGHGSRFTVRLPWAAPAAAVDPA